MSSLSVPLLIINLAGEMSYILEQRLKAQNFIEDKSVKVLHEIMESWLNKDFLDRLFSPCHIYQLSSMRQFFDRLAHTSIMRLNEASMEKLFHLMTMTVKYQVVTVTHPYELFNVTLNHLDGIRTIMKDNPGVLEYVDYAYTLVNNVYFTLPEWQMSLIRDTMLSFFVDTRIKVSILLREEKQDRLGHFILYKDAVQLPPKASIPGTIRYYINGEHVTSTSFPVKAKYVPNDVTEEEYDKRLQCEPTDRGTALGRNLYLSMTDIQVTRGVTGKDETKPIGDEFKLLSKLLQPKADNLDETQKIVLSLFDDDDATPVRKSSNRRSNSSTSTKVKISKESRTVEAAMKELAIRPTSKKGKGEDLANLLDEAVAETTPKRKASAKKRTGSATSTGSRTPSRSGSVKGTRAAH
uniref:Protein OSCP1 n=1 Tax=Panagrellus redivivus TaxID=6233 RepID=A0A7E4W8G5_PANRE